MLVYTVTDYDYVCHAGTSLKDAASAMRGGSAQVDMWYKGKRCGHAKYVFGNDKIVKTFDQWYLDHLTTDKEKSST